MQPLRLIQLTFTGTCKCNQLNAVRMQCTFQKLTKIILLTTVQFTFSIHHQSGGMNFFPSTWSSRALNPIIISPIWKSGHFPEGMGSKNKGWQFASKS